MMPSASPGPTENETSCTAQNSRALELVASARLGLNRRDAMCGNEIAQAVVELRRGGTSSRPAGTLHVLQPLTRPHTYSANFARRGGRAAAAHEHHDGPGRAVGEIPRASTPGRRLRPVATSGGAGRGRRTTVSRRPSSIGASGFSIISRAPVGPNISGSKNTGVKKMPNVRSTWTMYFTSRKNRLAQPDEQRRCRR